MKKYGKKQELIIIAAVAKNNVIGNKGKIPWHIREEFEHFKNTTLNHIVLMGKNTWFSLPSKYRPLPNRENIVLSQEPLVGDCKVCSSLNEALKYCKKFPEKKIFICGGASIYLQTIDLADKMILSQISEEFQGDTYFPQFDKKKWKLISEENKEKFVIKIYQKLNQI